MKNLKALALVLLLSFITFLTKGPLAALVVFAVINALLALPTREALSHFCLISPAAEFQQNTVLETALGAFKRAILNLTVFSTVFKNIPLKRNKNAKVEVPYYPLVTAPSKTFDQCYEFDDAYTVGTREILINKRQYQPISITSEEWNRGGDLIQYDKVFELVGEKLAYDTIQDVLSIVTAANYGAAVFTGADTTFDSDDAADLVAVADTIPWPETGRGMLVKPLYKANLLKDNDVKLEYAYGDDGVIKEAKLPRLMGFSFGSSPAIPANGENLVGFITHLSAILVGFSPIEPAPAVRQALVNYDVVTDPDTGITLEHRLWGDPDCDEERHIIEVNYGFAKGNEDALRRFVSA